MYDGSLTSSLANEKRCELYTAPDNQHHDLQFWRCPAWQAIMIHPIAECRNASPETYPRRWTEYMQYVPWRLLTAFSALLCRNHMISSYWIRFFMITSLISYVASNLWYIIHQTLTLKCYASRILLVSAQSIEARWYVKNEDIEVWMHTPVPVNNPEK